MNTLSLGNSGHLSIKHIFVFTKDNSAHKKNPVKTIILYLAISNGLLQKKKNCDLHNWVFIQTSLKHKSQGDIK